MQDWVAWIIALFQTFVQWLGSMQLLGVSLLWIMIACALLSVVFRAVLYKP